MRPCNANVTRSVCHFRHNQPQDAPASSRSVIWCQWHGAQMVYFVSQQSIAVCSLWVIINASKGRPVQCPAKVSLGTDLLPTVYSRPDRSSWDTQIAAASPHFRWHADFWLLSSVRTCASSKPHVCMYWWRLAMDAVQLAAAQHGKDGRSVVCVFSSAASDPGWTIEVESDLVQTVWSIRNLGIHLDSDLSMNTHITRTVSCCFAINTQHWSIRHRPGAQSLIVSLVVSRLDDDGQPPCMSARQTLVCLERCVWSTDLGNLTTWRCCCTTFTGCESQNKLPMTVLAYRCQNGLAPSWWPSPGGVGRVNATASFGSDCSTDRPSQIVLRSVIALYLSLPLRSWWRHQHPFRFSKNILTQFYLRAPSCHNKTFVHFILSPCFILRFYEFSIMCFSL